MSKWKGTFLRENNYFLIEEFEKQACIPLTILTIHFTKSASEPGAAQWLSIGLQSRRSAV
jgi:hypothetical protein